MDNKKKRGKKAIVFLLKYFILPLIIFRLTSWKIGTIVILVIVIRDIIKIRRRGYLIKDLEGKEVKTKEFLKRWKEGIEGITPLQQAKTNLMGNWITLTGILSGIIINALVRMKNQWWWIEIILLGSLILVVLQMISGLQRYWRIKAVDELQKELESNINNEELKIQ